MFVAISLFAVANDMTDAVKTAFADRPHLVDQSPGFVRMEVLSPLSDPKELWLITYWADRPSFEAWHNSHAYHESHAHIPKGLKLDPSRTSLDFFEYVTS